MISFESMPRSIAQKAENVPAKNMKDKKRSQMKPKPNILDGG
jgi:hypothetical protein